MKIFLLPLLALLGTTQAHYNFISIKNGGVQNSDWRYMRKVGVEPRGGQDNPIYIADVGTDKMRCNRDGARPASGIETLIVKAGERIGFKTNRRVFHMGPLMAYMAKVPAGQKVATWDGSGKEWFKIFEDRIASIISFFNDVGRVSTIVQWQNYEYTDFEFTIPSSLPNGEYLFRVEHIGLESSNVAEEIDGGPQFYISCAHLMVTDGGTGTPGPLVSFPGVYKKDGPGLVSDIYNQTVADALRYKAPGPPVWLG